MTEIGWPFTKSISLSFYAQSHISQLPLQWCVGMWLTCSQRHVTGIHARFQPGSNNLLSITFHACFFSMVWYRQAQSSWKLWLDNEEPQCSKGWAPQSSEERSPPRRNSCFGLSVSDKYTSVVFKLLTSFGYFVIAASVTLYRVDGKCIHIHLSTMVHCIQIWILEAVTVPYLDWLSPQSYHIPLCPEVLNKHQLKIRPRCPQAK